MIIDGRKISAQIKDKVRDKVSRLPFVPVFCDVLVGNDPVSLSYVNMKAKAAESLGMRFLRANFPADISKESLIAEIKKINLEPNLCGLIVQLPLPEHLQRDEVVDAIDVSVDVDCLNEKTLQSFYKGEKTLIPPTPGAVMAVLDSVLESGEGKKFVVVGQGELVGKPVVFLLKQRGFKVEIIDKATKDPAAVAFGADVLISATGVAGLVKKEWVKSGAIVIDAGTAESGGSIVGDVDFESVSKIASYISPVPGGVGPVTVAKLMQNVVEVAKRNKSER